MCESMRKVINYLFVILFFLLIILPGSLANFNQMTISESENRALATKPKMFDQNQNFNRNYTEEYEMWLADNIGFRNQFVAVYALTQYYLFHNLASEGMYLGTNDDLNYADDEMLLDYAHLNLRTDDELCSVSDDFQYLSDWLQGQGIQFYFMQCYDKHSIYPEQYMNHVYQYGTMSRADQLNQKLENGTTVNVVPVKRYLLNEKQNREVYSNWGDPTHWNEWGALIGYTALMDTINLQNDSMYKVLREFDYNCFEIDYGKTLNDIIHRQDMIEAFDLKEIHAVLQSDNSILGRFAEDSRHKLFINQDVDNNTRVLVFSDSYIDSYILDDIAESFSETAMVWSDNICDLGELIEIYKPNIIIFENVERRERVGNLSQFVKKISGGNE